MSRTPANGRGITFEQSIDGIIDSVKVAIAELQDKDGSSSVSIKNYLHSNKQSNLYTDRKSFNRFLPFIVAALHHGTLEGIFVNTGGRKWKINQSVEQPKSKSSEKSAATPEVVNLSFNRVATGSSKIFKVRRTLRLRKLFKAYSSEMEIPFEKLSFMKDGKRLINGTVESEGLKNYDEIDVHVHRSPSKSHDESLPKF